MGDIIIRNEQEKQLIEDFRLLQNEDKERILDNAFYSSLSNDEKDFLNKYRKLTEDQKGNLKKDLEEEI